MRIIHRASIVFLLKDIYSKTPVNTAVILCNGKQNPYTRKDDGHYVFSNLSPGKYNIYINCTGYLNLSFNINLKENETQIINLNLSYTPDNKNISSVTKFRIKYLKDKKPLINTPVKLILLNELKDIKVTEESITDSDLLKLNVDLKPELLDQDYLYESNEIFYEFGLFSYDSEKKSYVTKDLLHYNIPVEGKLFPVWELRTDNSGQIIMPVMKNFMKDNELKFRCIFGELDDLGGEIAFDVTDNLFTGVMFDGEVELKQLPEPKPKPAPKPVPQEGEKDKNEDSEEELDEIEDDEVSEETEDGEDSEEELDEIEDSEDSEEKLDETEDDEDSEEELDEIEDGEDSEEELDKIEDGEDSEEKLDETEDINEEP